MALDQKLLFGLRGATEGAFGSDQRRAFLPLSAARVVPRVSPSGSASAAPTLAVLACVAAGLGASLLSDCVGFIGMTGVRMCDIERPNGLPKVGLALIRRIHPRRKLVDRFWQACLDQAPVAG